MISFAKIPKAGLANRLIVWASAYAFAKKNNFLFLRSSLSEVSLGPFLRRENKKRIYFNFFKRRSVFEILRTKYYVSKYSSNTLELGCQQINDQVVKDKNKLYMFNKANVQPFEDLLPYRKEIRSEFYNLLNSEYLIKAKSLARPTVGVHVRRGDFLHAHNKTALSTSLTYFVEIISFIRSELEYSGPITIFSDGRPEELIEILSLDNVHLAESNSDVLDIISLSLCKIIVTCPKSTFSAWAAFISDALVIINEPSTSNKWIRYNSSSDFFFEGNLNSAVIEIKQIQKVIGSITGIK